VKCIKCDNKKNIKAKNINFDYSKKSGINGCFISAKEYKCPECETVFHDLGEDKEIKRAIAEVIAGAEPEQITRQMLLYIRRQLLEESTFNFAKRIGVNPSVYELYEKHKKPMTLDLAMAVQEEIFNFYLREKPPEVTIAIGKKKTKIKSKF
jgi:hypothetical protein